jgi:hypothetical protein
MDFGNRSLNRTDHAVESGWYRNRNLVSAGYIEDLASHGGPE